MLSHLILFFSWLFHNCSPLSHGFNHLQYEESSLILGALYSQERDNKSAISDDQTGPRILHFNLPTASRGYSGWKIFEIY